MTVNINYSAIVADKNNHGALKRVVDKNTYLNQVNGTPISLSPGLPDLEDQFSQLGFIDLRAHDWYGVADIDSYYNSKISGYIGQITNNAPENKKASIKIFAEDFFNRRTICLNAVNFYSGKEDAVFNWGPTDLYLKKSLSNSYYNGNRKPNILFRIGRMLDGGRREPNNVDKYCELVKEVVLRYSVNYKKAGLPYPIIEYEVWNEPDLGLFWSTPDTPQNAVKNFYDFYKKVSTTIINVYPKAIIGTCGAANAYGNKDYVDKLVEYIRNNKLPFGFYSYHYYADSTADPKSIIEIQNYVRNILNKYNYNNTKTYITEWNLTAYGSKENNTKLQSAFAGSFMVSFLINAEQSGVDKAYLYRGDGAEFGLFNDQSNPQDSAVKSFSTYAAQCMYLYNLFTVKREKSILLKEDTSNYGVYTAGAINKKGDELYVLIANYKVDKNYVGDENKNKLPSNVEIQAQYYIDDNVKAENLEPKKWYGSEFVPKINNNDVGDVPQGPYSSNDNGNLKKDTSEYSNSSSGYSLKITDLPKGYTHWQAIVKRVYSGAQLSSLDGETFTGKLKKIAPNRTLTVNGNVPEKAGYYTVALVIIKLS
ncbi:TPA: hypothetical protein U2J82_004890 [Serratia marcescens]|nr:hypothetical protein [Klebsiella aerogenes]HEM7555763.1 hypothetical protein [Serratia marcescens]